jgi:hypothetical protein
LSAELDKLVVDDIDDEEVADGPVEELILAGTAFGECYPDRSIIPDTKSYVSGFGLFNLVFSLLPKKIQYVPFLAPITL